MNTISRSKLEEFLNKILNIHQYQDYGPNGLQIEGCNEITKIAFAVSAQKESISKSIEGKANCLIAHHGLFWKFHGVRTITKSFGERVRPLIQNDINLFSYHLPLDAHIKYGNAASIAQELAGINILPFGDYKGMPTGVKFDFPSPINAISLKNKLKKILKHNVLHSSPKSPEIKNMGIITGGANSDWKMCIKENLNSYLTGEMSEHDWHEAKEDGVHMFAGGHNATEELGIQKLQKLIEEKFDIECFFIPSQNPA